MTGAPPPPPPAVSVAPGGGGDEEEHDERQIEAMVAEAKRVRRAETAASGSSISGFFYFK
jgi:hypothetical protein